MLIPIEEYKQQQTRITNTVNKRCKLKRIPHFKSKRSSLKLESLKLEFDKNIFHGFKYVKAQNSARNSAKNVFLKQKNSY